MTGLFFDLDGTLTDSSEGITKCAQLALRHYGVPADDLDALRVFIGPPLRETFPKFGIPQEQVEDIIRVFRGRYLTVGKFENRPYPGIRDVLERLKAKGYPLYVATSKPEETATEILSKFELAKYFDCICGATMDGVRDSKESVLQYLLQRIGSENRAIMIGDTKFDVIGANAFGIPTIGVTWGFGTREELLEAGAVAIADTQDELLQLIDEMA